MAAKDPLTFELNDDNTLVIATPTHPIPFSMDTLSIESLIAVLMAIRCEMNPRRTQTDPFEGTQMISHPSMRWYCARDPNDPGLGQLGVMHPGIGWIGLLIDRTGADALTKELRKIRPAPRSKAPPK